MYKCSFYDIFASISPAMTLLNIMYNVWVSEAFRIFLGFARITAAMTLLNVIQCLRERNEPKKCWALACLGTVMYLVFYA